MAVNMLTYPVHQFLTDEDLCTWGVPWEQLPSVPWLKRDVGVFRRITTRLNDNGAWLDGLTFLFAKDRGQMTAPERETARIFLPHVAKAVELTRPFQLLKIRFQGVLSALNHLNIGLLLLSESGAVVVKNAEAERILDLKDGLSIDSGGRLRARAGSGDEVLGAAVAAAVSTAKAEGNDSGTLLAVARPSLSDSFLLSVAPLIDSTLGLSDGLRGAMVFIIDPQNRAVISTAGMEALYDLTSAEASVCRLLVDGHPTQDIADMRNVGLETVRTQVKSILGKTRSAKRADVVRLALTVNLPVDQPEETGGT